MDDAWERTNAPTRSRDTSPGVHAPPLWPRTPPERHSSHGGRETGSIPTASRRRGSGVGAARAGSAEQRFVRSRAWQALKKTGRKYIRSLASVNGIFLSLFKSDPSSSPPWPGSGGERLRRWERCRRYARRRRTTAPTALKPRPTLSPRRGESQARRGEGRGRWGGGCPCRLPPPTDPSPAGSTGGKNDARPGAAQAPAGAGAGRGRLGPARSATRRLRSSARRKLARVSQGPLPQQLLLRAGFHGRNRERARR